MDHFAWAKVGCRFTLEVRFRRLCENIERISRQDFVRCGAQTRQTLPIGCGREAFSVHTVWPRTPLTSMKALESFRVDNLPGDSPTCCLGYGEPEDDRQRWNAPACEMRGILNTIDDAVAIGKGLLAWHMHVKQHALLPCRLTLRLAH